MSIQTKQFNILVTGAYGQLGSELKYLTADSIYLNCVFTDIDTVDITDKNAIQTLITNQQFDFIVNCAAYTAVDKAEEEYEYAFLINQKAVKNLSEICQTKQIKLIHISTDYVFDGKGYQPYNENDAVNPQSAYGKSKLGGEEIALSYPLSTIIRTSWLYSSFGNNFVKTIYKLADERNELKVVFDQVGTPTYARDLANTIVEILLAAFKNPKDYIPGLYHFSNEGLCSWYDFAWEIVRLSGKNCKIIPVETKEYPLPAPRPMYSVLNKSKIKNAYSITIPYWKESLEKCLNLLANN